MNPIKKLYCRAFQAGFRLIYPLLPYRKPEILHRVKAIPEILRLKGCGRVLIITDRILYESGLLSPLKAALKKKKISCFIYSDVVANPTTKVIYEATSFYKEHHCEALIGFGGGSSIDTAKAVGALIAKPGKSLDDIKGVFRVFRPIPLLIAVPTTAGTGSETTLASIITDSETRHKYAMEDFFLIPRYAVLDPGIAVTLPKSLTATTGMDALTHATEAYIGESTTKETRYEAKKAVNLIFNNILNAYENGSSLKARKKMLYASFLAGDAFSKSYVGYVHAVSHSLGGAYDVPHGFANAVTLPYFLKAYGKTIYKKLHELAMAAGISSASESHEIGAKKYIEAIEKLNEKMGIPAKIPEIREEDIPLLSRYADKEANPLYPVPVLWNAKELERFYRMLLKGEYCE